jgi:hypothetical protein
MDLAVLLTASVWLSSKFLVLHAERSPKLVLSLSAFQSHQWFPGPEYRWWSWWDQRYYLEAALAWSQGVLDPSRHWYLPGYALLGAPFAKITPADPFLLPDLGCLIGSLWLFAWLGGQLLAGMRHGRAVSAAVFAATTGLSPLSLQAWVIPWTTTPETACILGCLLATAVFIERPRPASAFMALLSGVAVAAFRPADAAAITLTSCLAGAWTVWRHRPGPRRPVVIAGAAAAGGAIPAVVFGGAYVAVHGWHASVYVALSDSLGFEWRLLPVRWVTLMIDPRPMFPEGQGLAGAFPWIVPGLAGMAAALVAPAAPGAARRHLHTMVAAAVVADSAVLLSYRDLHQTGLLRFHNYHYFNWLLPVFGIYAVVLLRGLVAGPRLRTAGVLAGVVAAAVMWRVELTEAVALGPITDPHVIYLPQGLSGMNAALLVKASGNLPGLYDQTSVIRSGDTVFPSFLDYKLFSWFGDVMAIPLRPLPGKPSTLELPHDVELDVSAEPVMARQSLVWGVPCLILPRRAACRYPDLLPPSRLAPGTLLSFAEGGNAALYIRDGFSSGESDGRWTDGSRATLTFRVDHVPSGSSCSVVIKAHGFAPNGAAPTSVRFAADGIDLGERAFGNERISVTLNIPGQAIGQDGSLKLDFLITNPRRPASYGLKGSRDLGIYVESAQFDLVVP